MKKQTKQFNISDIGPAVMLFPKTDTHEAIYKATTGEYLIETDSSPARQNVLIVDQQTACNRAIELRLCHNPEGFYRTVERALWVETPIVPRPEKPDPLYYLCSDFCAIRRQSLLQLPVFYSCALVDSSEEIRSFRLTTEHTHVLLKSIDALLSNDAISGEPASCGNEQSILQIADQDRFLFELVTQFGTYQLETFYARRKQDFPLAFKGIHIDQSCWTTSDNRIPDYDLTSVAIASIAVNLALIMSYEINREVPLDRTDLPTVREQILYKDYFE